MLTLGLVSDLHFGPAATFEGKLRKLTHEAEPLLRRALAGLAREGVDVLVNLGDDLEDETPALDRARYLACQALLREGPGELVNVAGNHDAVHLTDAELAAAWGRPLPLHYAIDRGGHRLVVLRTVEVKDAHVTLPGEQLAWLEAELRATPLPVVVLVHHPLGEQDLARSRWFHAAPHLALVREREAVRRVLETAGNVRVVLNGHVHRNALDVVGGIPYVTVQSLVENLDDDAPGRAAGAHTVVRLGPRWVDVDVLGEDRASYRLDRPIGRGP